MIHSTLDVVSEKHGLKTPSAIPAHLLAGSRVIKDHSSGYNYKPFEGKESQMENGMSNT